MKSAKEAIKEAKVKNAAFTFKNTSKEFVKNFTKVMEGKISRMPDAMEQADELIELLKSMKNIMGKR